MGATALTLNLSPEGLDPSGWSKGIHRRWRPMWAERAGVSKSEGRGEGKRFSESIST